MIYIIVLNYNGKEDTIACVRSLLAMTEQNFKLIIVDNGSQNDSVASFREAFPSIHLIETRMNLGYAGGNNVGIRYALQEGAESILILNNDTIVHPGLLTAFVETSKLHPEAILGARIYQFGQDRLFQAFAANWSHRKGKFISEPSDLLDDGRSWETVQKFDFVNGCALFVPRKVWESVGLFEESFFLYYEEMDWCFRAQKVGIPSLYCPTAKLWHRESASLKNPRPPQSYFQWRNRIFFVERNFSRKVFIHWLATKLIKRVFILWVKKWFYCFRYYIAFLWYRKKMPKKFYQSYLVYRASLRGVHDYFLRRFGNGPNWIYTYTQAT